MRRSVVDAFVAFNGPIEGVLNHMYLDVKGLVTTGIGNLVDPVAGAMSLPWRRKDGSLATPREIAAEWIAVKAKKEWTSRGGVIYGKMTSLHLDEDGILRVVSGRLQQMASHLRSRFPDFDEWCADAQMATLSLSWACGPGFRFPGLDAALRAKNYSEACMQCTINETGNPGVRPRNVANRVMYRNAAVATRESLDPETLWWPRSLADDQETSPDVNKASDRREYVDGLYTGRAIEDRTTASRPTIYDDPEQPIIHVDPSLIIGNSEPE